MRPKGQGSPYMSMILNNSKNQKNNHLSQYVPLLKNKMMMTPSSIMVRNKKKRIPEGKNLKLNPYTRKSY